MSKRNHAIENAAAWLENIRDMIARLETDEPDADDNTVEQIQEAARQEIQESPLSVEIRDGWRTPGSEGEVEEYRILLSTGGPALRIIGRLGQHNEPDSARLEWQDWGTPWIEYVAPDGKTDTAALLKFAQQFYFEDC